MTLKISQVFGPTVQGEGSAAGRHCMFIRTFNCNLECSWCDTAYTWAVTDEKAAKTRDGVKYEKDEPNYGLKEMEPEEVIDRLRKLWDVKLNPTIIVVSGGEPMMQQHDLMPVIKQLHEWGNEIHVETAGTISPLDGEMFDQWVTQYNVSPKLAHSGNIMTKRFKPKVLRQFVDTEKAWFKFVVTSDYRQDLEEIDTIVETIEVDPKRVMVMPEGSEPSKNISIAQMIADEAISLGYGVSFRSHVFLWGDDPDK